MYVANRTRYADGMLAAWLDRVLYRHPFEGPSARRYATAERPAFGDLDDRLLDAMPLAAARCLLDLGAGPATFAMRAAARWPTLEVIAVVRAAGEALPIADARVDVAVCLSSIRHVRDRAVALAELRRVVRAGGSLFVVELDPAADARRIATHADRLGGALLRHAFGPLVVRTAPPADAIEALARSVGWHVHARRDDPIQPVYIMGLA
jgi:ubiquinone/menaquinone biosynthesis C-methylase UbiE